MGPRIPETGSFEAVETYLLRGAMMSASPNLLPNLLWIDFLVKREKLDLPLSLPKSFAVQPVRWPFDLCHVMKSTAPWAACFDFDTPTRKGLEVLERVRSRFQSLPVVMLTTSKSKIHQRWAVQQQIWDYIQKPCTVKTVCDSLRPLHAEPSVNVVGTTAQPKLSSPEFNKLSPAVAYLRANYPDKIPLAKAADMCDLSPFQFSRIFKKVNGITFQDYVVQLRIRRAAELMKQRRSSVTDAAFEVGFNDLSYFARMFRKQIGMCPSRYRADTGPSQIALFPQLERAELQDSATSVARKS
ncbi:response regulator transcription factor [Granulicella sibirica]|uniref:Transcriptional regulator, AraC family n=1 Tax=Granulicella sibirica TaxID=2479048 RepID=A0A4Q0T299_9BACT|nr:response regulator transcription factor [Granulicella sibirica]RXH56530.1 Transcriptional regulator, AraC family [Granulicella sibirica]